MMPKLTPEQRFALAGAPDQPLFVSDDETNRLYVIVDNGLHERAMHALRAEEDRAAIREGIADVEAGRIVTLDEVEARVRQRLGSATQP